MIVLGEQGKVWEHIFGQIHVSYIYQTYDFTSFSAPNTASDPSMCYPVLFIVS